MKVLNLSTKELKGGAAIAAKRLHCAFLEKGINSEMLVKDRQTNDPSVHTLGETFVKKGLRIVAPTFDQLPLKFYRKQDTTWHTGWITTGNYLKSPLLKNADIIILYWVCDGFLSVKSIGKIMDLNKPVVWRLSDFWPFTGGCHYPGSCNRYQVKCGKCPQIGSNFNYDLSRYNWVRKSKNWNIKNLTIVCPSNWLMNCVNHSSLFNFAKVKLIPTGVDVENFKPIDRMLARTILNLPFDRTLVLFGAFHADDPRKGSKYLKNAISLLETEIIKNHISLVVFGSNNKYEFEQEFSLFLMGNIQDEFTLALLYSACDIFVAPSTEDNLPNTVIEALACGTPCVAFNIGGMPDLIKHKINGYLAKPFCAHDLKEGIKWVLKKIDGTNINKKYTKEYNNLSKYARKTIMDNFTMDLQVENYLKLFTELGLSKK